MAIIDNKNARNSENALKKQNSEIAKYITISLILATNHHMKKLQKSFKNPEISAELFETK